jgi:predicted pyridoxine 5'-phosphate oxidase superfamily flavin-nucleotide-binding protein
MNQDPFGTCVASEQELRELVGTPGEIAIAKQIPALDEHCRMLISRSPYVLLGTSDTSGRCDVSPKGDAPGFVRVIDDSHLVIPDRPGNKRVDGMRNILDNPHVGLLFLIPRRHETLRVNGLACIHCGKASFRSHLWEQMHWPDVSELASPGCMLFEHAKPDGMTVEAMDRRFDDDRNRLY